MNVIVLSIASRFLSSSSPSLRVDLREIRDCWFHLLLFCTVIVAVGVLLEEVDLWLPFGKSPTGMSALSKGIFIPSPWKKRKARIAWLGLALIIVGVLGESLFEALISNADGMLQNLNETVLAITGEQAGDAAKSATIARREADGAKQSAQGERKEREKAQIGLEKEQQKTARAQEDAAKAQLALKARFENVSKLQAARDIDRGKFFARLKGKPQSTVVIWYASGDQGSFLFAQQAWLILASRPPLGAGWPTTNPLPIPKDFIVQQPAQFMFVANISGLSGDFATAVRAPPPYNPGDPIESQYRGSYAGGITLLTKNFEDAKDPSDGTALSALTAALSDSMQLNIVIQREDSVPDGTIILVITEKLVTLPAQP